MDGFQWENILANAYGASIEQERQHLLRIMKRKPFQSREGEGDEPTFIYLEDCLQYQQQQLQLDFESLLVATHSSSAAANRPQSHSVAYVQDEAVGLLSRPPIPTDLPEEIDWEVTKLLSRTGEISRLDQQRVSAYDIAMLKPQEWLNDEVVNFYGAMILARSAESDKLNVHMFTSFFFAKLKGYGYEKGKLSTWTRKFDIFAKDAVLMPINHNRSHWTAASINFRRKRIESYDSIYSKRRSRHVIQKLREYLDAEHRDKKQKPFDFTDWEDWAPKDAPQQDNCYDCGVFTMHVLEALSRGEEGFLFSQKDMPYLRRRMIWEIGHAQLRGGHYA